MRALSLLLALAACDAATERSVSSDGVRHARLLPPPPGAVARGAAAVRADLKQPRALSAAVGASGFRDFCAACHGAEGRGDGIVIRYGLAQPRPLQEVDRSPARTIAVITRGYRTMLPMAGQITPAERWAIAAHVARLPR